MKLKSILFGLVLLLSFGLTTRVVWAADGAYVTKIQERLTAHVTNTANRQANELTAIQQRAGTMIDERITALTKLLGRINEDTRLSSEDKTTMSNDIQTTIGNLQALKAKIQADTDATTARTDAKTIVSSYHIFVIYEPKERLLVAISNLQTVSSNVQTITTNIQNFLNDEKAKGVDITAAQASLNDIISKLSDINTKLASDKASLTNLSVTSTDGSAKTVFTQVRQDLTTIRQDFATIRQDFAKIKTGLTSEVKSARLSGTPVPQLTCIPRPKCLDASPRCAIAEPAHGWCPKTTIVITPTPTP